MGKSIPIENINDMANIFGNNDSNISIVEEAFNVKTEISDNNILIRGEEGERLFLRGGSTGENGRTFRKK